MPLKVLIGLVVGILLAAPACAAAAGADPGALAGPVDVSGEWAMAELSRQGALLGDVPQLICAILFSLVGLYHILLFRRRTQLREYLWFGLVCFGAATNILFASEWARQVMPPLGASAVALASIHLNAVAWVQFVWLLFGWRFRWWVRAYQGLHLALAVVSGLFPAFVGAHFGLVPVLLLTPILVLWLVCIPLEAWRGNPDARTMMVGIAILAATRFYQLLGLLAVVPSANYTHWGFLALILSIAVTLANRFSRVYGEIDALNRDLESKVAQRTAELAETVARLRESEREAREAHRAALEASRAKSTFLANMSHELRTPLNAILGFVQLMKRNRSVDADGRESLAIIMHAGEHLLGLINDILSISKIEAGQMTLNERVFDLHRLVRGLDETFQPRAEAKGLAFEVGVAPGLPRFVLGDDGKLRQVLINLLGNAMKFTEAGRVGLRAAWAGDRAVFEVEDTGYGIAAGEMEQLFEAFSQTQSGVKVREGTGLGLVISRSFARLMGGDVTVRSEPGRGSIFRVEVALPAVADEREAAEPRTVVGLGPGEAVRRILVVDDVVENRKLLARLMRVVGFDVREAANGRQAVDIWSEWRPELVWMDMRMPVLDGIGATREIRELEAGLGGPTTMIVALTASAFEHDRERILEAGCDDFVTKPFLEATLFAKIATHLGVRFEYAEDEAGAAHRGEDEAAAALSPAAFAGLPSHLLARFERCLNEGAVEETNAAVDDIGVHDEALARELRPLVRGYRFDEILAVIEKADA